MNDEHHLGIRDSAWRLWTLLSGGASLLLLLALIATGCSGINAGGSVSPLDFFMPGLLQNHPASPILPPETNGVSLLALASPDPQ